MLKAQRYRREAAEAEAMARQMSRADHREECLRIARAWLELAEEVERRLATEDRIAGSERA